MILISSLLFKANYEEFADTALMGPMSDANSEECVPPPSKKARANNASPAMQYDRCPKPPSSTLPAQVQPARKLKREWANSFNAEATQDREIAGTAAQEHSDAASSTFIHALPGPSGDAPPTQGQEVTHQHALSGPSGIQILPSDFANVSIFSYLSYGNIYQFLPTFIGLFYMHHFRTLCKSISQRDIERFFLPKGNIISIPFESCQVHAFTLLLN